ncbi:hypothetical protein VNI00_001135 [Paramarasmius palmivorus]|uniref:Ribosome maturation protein SDO1/SBDS N-terminal domain-containing protein n=1 Tax=Paramarasmius palmivorus TaxID=297713 RepID=A0AAW0E7T5_9AGAR
MRSLTKVVYKPDPQSTDEFTIIVNPEEYKKWKDGGGRWLIIRFIRHVNYDWKPTIPLADVVDSFQVFHSNQGSQGLLATPSRQQLDGIFGTSKDIDVVQKMLELGKSQPAKFSAYTFQTNAAKGSMVIDTKGGRSTKGI